jgi:hypothetical protein
MAVIWSLFVNLRILMHKYIMSTIRKLIERELTMKAELKQLREEIKSEIEGTATYNSVYEAAIDVRDVNVNQKAAKAHAFRVVYDALKPKDDEDEE